MLKSAAHRSLNTYWSLLYWVLLSVPFAVVTLLVFTLVTTSQASIIASSPPGKDATRTVLFLGDSNTFAGGFIAQLDARMICSTKTNDCQILNLGVPSETASGLSEPKHPFPRPCVHERLQATLELVKPDVVVACYGMNDGIYYPFDENRLQAYLEGMRRLVEMVKKTGSEIVLLTAPPFDPNAVTDFGPDRDGEYSWLRPARDYAQTMKRYGIELQEMIGDDAIVLDLHSAILEWKELNRSDAANSLGTLQGTEKFTSDGVHWTPKTHAMVSAWLEKNLVALPAFSFIANDPMESQFGPDPSTNERLQKSVQLSHREIEIATERMEVLRNAWLKRCGWNRPNLPDGLPVQEAQVIAQKFADELRELSKPKR